ncbi:MAG: YaaA family protein, partial [Gammaproteobacteria bacterium]|nr:YaaA family protein [Gammaproteobacteria bacterium]
MLIVISPAKTLDYESQPETKKFTLPDYLEQSQQLIKYLREYSPQDISQLMNVSSKIA